jgi:hypothetical protein
MISKELLTAIIYGGLVLIILDLSRCLIERTIVRRLLRRQDLQIVFWPPFVVNLIFMVLIPAAIYSALYPILPFEGHNSGLFIGLFVFGVGVLPASIRNYHQYQLPTALVAFQLLWGLLTLLVVLGAITYVYQ